jgi:protocatechuate 3,4-dioxygenase beta subunit
MPSPTPQLGQQVAAPLSRRLFLGLGGGSAAALAAGAAPRIPLGRRGTPVMTVGPYYPVDRLAESDADLTRIAGRAEAARGPIIDLVGQVIDESSVPVGGAILDIWQANSAGRYHHPADPSDSPLDPGFQGAALIRADSDGRFSIRTVLPGPYDNRIRHIHFDVRGRHRRLITQMFFPDEQNQADSHYRALASDALQAAVTAKRLAADRFAWTIVLAGE